MKIAFYVSLLEISEKINTAFVLVFFMYFDYLIYLHHFPLSFPLSKPCQIPTLFSFKCTALLLIVIEHIYEFNIHIYSQMYPILSL